MEKLVTVNMNLLFAELDPKLVISNTIRTSSLKRCVKVFADVYLNRLKRQSPVDSAVTYTVPILEEDV